MSHMVAPISDVMDLDGAIELLRKAHDHLAEAGRRALQASAIISDVSCWGCAVKRNRVELGDPRPTLLEGATLTHSLAEVVNQCATIERLLDALTWVTTQVDDEARVLRCNPTTSSSRVAPDGIPDHDLVVRASSDRLYCVEVSDVASDKADGNQKEAKDLHSLGFIGSVTQRPYQYTGRWPECRSFLAVSEEFATRLMKPRRHLLEGGILHYERVNRDTTTWLLEVVRGPHPDLLDERG